MNDLIVRDRVGRLALNRRHERFHDRLHQVEALVLDHLRLRGRVGPSRGDRHEAERVEARPRRLGDAVLAEHGDAIARRARQRAVVGRDHAVLVLHGEHRRIVHQRRRAAGVDAIDLVHLAAEIDERIDEVHAETGHRAGRCLVGIHAPGLLGERQPARRRHFTDAERNGAEAAVAHALADLGD